MKSIRRFDSWCSLALLAALVVATKSPAAELPKTLRRPVALALSADDQTLYVGNQRSGSISIIDTASRSVAGEALLGQRISDLARAGELLLAVDEHAHELLLLRPAGAELHVQQRLAVSPYPVDIVVSRDGRRCFVTSLWSRRLSLIELAGSTPGQARVTRVVDMPFAPREQLLVRGDSRLIVGDAFGGNLAVVDANSGDIGVVRQFPGHNVRGLEVSPEGKMLVIAHQMLNELAHTVRNDVHWGLLMSNDLRWLRLDNVLAHGESDLYDGAHMHPLGEASNATGDPSGLTITSQGLVIAALGGVGEVALGKERDFSLYRLKVGRRPTAVTATADGQRAFVANTFGDSISFIDLTERAVSHTTKLGPAPKLTLADEGELLFYDASLSHDSWMSCHSCHTDGHTNGSLNDNFSDASFGAPKRVLSLLGRSDTAPFGWNASAAKMSDQIRKTITHTMQSDQPPHDHHVAALDAFLATLETPPSLDELRAQSDLPAIDRGSKLFAKMNCANCHAPPTYTTPKTYNVGLRDKLGNEKFNPPSLRGVGQRTRYFHDNRAASLEAVFRDHGHQLDRELTEEEIRDLTAFLRSL